MVILLVGENAQHGLNQGALLADDSHFATIKCRTAKGSLDYGIVAAQREAQPAWVIPDVKYSGRRLV